MKLYGTTIEHGDVPKGGAIRLNTTLDPAIWANTPFPAVKTAEPTHDTAVEASFKALDAPFAVAIVDAPFEDVAAALDAFFKDAEAVIAVP